MSSEQVRLHQLLRQVETRRRLPPATWLPEPRTTEERRLLADILALPATEDPLRWLQAERGPLTARLAMDALFTDVQGRVRGARQALHYGWQGALEGPAWLSKLVQRADFPLYQSDGPAALPSPQALRQTLSTLRFLVGPSASRSEAVASPRDRLLTLLTELVMLPETVDPLDWLQRERGTEMAELVLARLLLSSRPPRTLDVGPVMRVLRPRAAISPADGIRVIVREVVFGAGATRLTMRVRARARDRREQARYTATTWTGFSALGDDRGNRYIMQHWEQGATTGCPWWESWTISQVFYPAIAPEIGELTFSAGPGTVDTRQFRLSAGGAGIELLGELPSIGREVTWRLPVPNRR